MTERFNLQEKNRLKIRSMISVLIISFLLVIFKFIAYFLTGSNAILTDALESIINVVAGGFALFSVYFSSFPKDENHPYGHGKIEFISAGFEGGLIFIAGIFIIGKAIYGLFNPYQLDQLYLGIIITGIAGVVNLFLGLFLVKRGKAYQSLTMQADGKHLLTDTYSSAGLVLGLIVIYFTNIYWLDHLLAIGFGSFILFTGYKLVRQSVAGLLDETDYETLEGIVEVLNHNRRDKWIDIHNLRVQKYGDLLHIDCHMTLPWYDNLEEVHKEVEAVEQLVNEKMRNQAELFIHADPCLPSSCPFCTIKDCPVRQHDFQERVSWKLDNLMLNKRHGR